MARLGTSAGVRYAGLSARSAFASPDQRVALQERFELQTAEQVAETLGNMKGALMKLGQMASYLDQGLPEPVREVLAQLQSAAPPMAAELAAEVIRSELGAPAEAVFASWDPTSIAAASIGQVHRATTHDGREVAVKVQYPGVADAIRADLDNSDLVFGALGFLFPGLDPKPIVAELRARLLEELDYENEATNQTRFVEYYVGHPTIHVPAVVPELSTKRVLTSEFVEGASFAEVLTWPQEQRNLAAETIYRYTFGGIYRVGTFNGDPHPGNYLFGADGRVTFLDYGLCKVFRPDEVKLFEDLIQAMVLDPDMGRFMADAKRIGFFAADAHPDEQLAFDYFRHFYEFVLYDETMTFTPQYASESVRRYFDVSGPYAEMIKGANVPQSMVIIQRINLGLFAVFAELGATANWRRIAEEIWPFVSGPPSTPMGEAVALWDAQRVEVASRVVQQEAP